MYIIRNVTFFFFALILYLPLDIFKLNSFCSSMINVYIPFFFFTDRVFTHSESSVPYLIYTDKNIKTRLH